MVGEYDGMGALIAHYTHGLGLVSQVDAAGMSFSYDFDAHRLHGRHDGTRWQLRQQLPLPAVW